MNNKSAAIIGFCVTLVVIGWVIVAVVAIRMTVTVLKKLIEMIQGKGTPVISAAEWAIAFENKPTEKVEVELPPVAPARKRKKKETDATSCVISDTSSKKSTRRISRSADVAAHA